MVLLEKKNSLLFQQNKDTLIKKNIKMFDFLYQSSENIFDQFKSKKTLEEEHCKNAKLTGWSREIFFEFSDSVLSKS